MASDLGMGITVSLKDLFSGPASKVSKNMTNMGNQAAAVPGKFQKMDQALKALAGAAIFQKSKQMSMNVVTPAMDLQAAIS